MRVLVGRLTLLILTFMFAIQSFANVLEQETFLSNHFTDVMKSYDSRGVVRVDIEVSDKKVELPGTNFIVNTNLIGEFDKSSVKSLTVNVFSELSEIPEEFKNYIESKTKKYTKKTNIQYIKLDKQINGLENQIANGLEKLSSKMGGDSNLIYVLLSIPLAIFGIALFFRGQLNRATNVMGSELQSLAQVLQEQGIGTSQEHLAVQTEKAEAGAEHSSTILEQSMWEMMNEEFYVGLISDCYWCLEDNYASFIWSKVPVELKRTLLASGKIEEDYIKYISDLKPVDKSFGSNSYYLKPWEYSHISNDDLAKLIVEDKRLFGFISPMRLTKLNLSLEEKLECIKAGGNSTKMKEEFFTTKISNMPASSKREFDSTGEFEFASFEEENQLIKMDIDFTIMKKFPTLGWMLKLSDEKIVEILSTFQAKELVSALYTSEEIKAALLSKMPEKRRELIESYSQKVKGAKNKTYASIMKMVYAELSEIYEKNKPELKEVKSA